MRYKRSIIVLALAIFMLSVAGAWASDTNDIMIASGDDSPIKLSAEDNDDIMAVDENEDTLKADEQTFGDLNNTINGNNDLNIYLEHDYKYSDGDSAFNEGIVIDRDVYVYGNGHTINGSSQARIFKITSGNVVFHNITFTNGKTTEMGGAAYFGDGATGSLINCNFTGNTATDGGAVYFVEGSVGEAIDCKFTDNTATSSGGALVFLGNGTVTDCNFIENTGKSGKGGAVYLGTGTVTNCNFTNNKEFDLWANGGAVYFNGDGTVSNCNFVSNSAARGYGGAVYFNGDGNVTLCIFTANFATYEGGAVYFNGDGNVSNCIFEYNDGLSGGAVSFDKGGNVSNCNFTDNTADIDGGALYFGTQLGYVLCCNFDGNSAKYGGALYFLAATGYVLCCNFDGNAATKDGGAIYRSTSFELTADTCIFKTNLDSVNNIRLIPPTLNVNSFTTFYNSGEKLTFNLKTNSGIPVNNGIISISVYFKNSLVGNYTCLSGEGWIPDLPVGSYNAIFDTEYPEFQQISRTITITIPDIRYYANITSFATHNKTVNITAVSDIPQNLFWDNKLLFILPDGTDIEAYYDSNCTWRAEYTFDEYGIYQIHAAHANLRDLMTNVAIINIHKVNSTILSDHVSLNYGESINFAVATEGAECITAKIDDAEVTVVNNFTVLISGLSAGNHTLTVTTMPDADHVAVTKNVTVEVFKADSTVSIEKINPGKSFIVVSTNGATGVTARIDGVDLDVVDNYTIFIPSLAAGDHILSITTVPDVNHNPVTRNVTIEANRIQTVLAGSAVTATYNVNKDLVITLKDANGNPVSGASVTVDLNGAKTYVTDKNGQIKVSTKGLAPKTYTVKVTFNGNNNYVQSSKSIKVTVKKANPKLTTKKKTFKKSVKVKKYSIVLKDNLGKAIKNAKVTIKVGKKTFKAKTNSKGKAVFKIKKLTKKGTYKAKVTFKGDKYYNKATKKVKITIK